MSEWLDFGLRIANTVAIVITWLFLLITQVRKKIKQAHSKNTDTVMNINKEKQSSWAYFRKSNFIQCIFNSFKELQNNQYYYLKIKLESFYINEYL